jgi:threonine dehydratase
MGSTGQSLVGPDDLQNAAQRVAAITRPTPLIGADWLSALVKRSVYLKPEHVQRTGSYKVRGSFNHLCAMVSDGQLRAGDPVVAASAGNHAQGFAIAATTLGLRPTVFMPATASLPKVEATQGYGADVVLESANVDEAITAAVAFAHEHNAHFVPPFDDPLVIAGQGTVGLEILSETAQRAINDVSCVVVPIGGGGLISGVAAAIKQAKPEIYVVGVQASGAAAMHASFLRGEVITLPSVSTIADGIALKSPGHLTFTHVQAYVDEIITVSDEAISRAVVMLLERSKALVEPAGAVAVAAVLCGEFLQSSAPTDGSIVAITSGGNVDPLLLMRIIEQGLGAAGRYLAINVILTDRPGQLSLLARAFSELNLNVIEVDYHRRGLNLSLNEVEIRVTVETRGPEHRDTVVPALTERGFTVSPA